jgi:hypothetical protein
MINCYLNDIGGSTAVHGCAATCSPLPNLPTTVADDATLNRCGLRITSAPNQAQAAVPLNGTVLCVLSD